MEACVNWQQSGRARDVRSEWVARPGAISATHFVVLYGQTVDQSGSYSP